MKMSYVFTSALEAQFCATEFRFDVSGRGVMRLDNAPGKKQVWRSHVRIWGLSEVNGLYGRKYLWHFWNVFHSTPEELCPPRCTPGFRLHLWYIINITWLESYTIYLLSLIFWVENFLQQTFVFLLQNILYRYGVNRGLHFAMPEWKSRFNSFNYPAKFSTKYVHKGMIQSPRCC